MRQGKLIAPTICLPPEPNEPIDGYLWFISQFSSRRRMKGLVDFIADRQVIQAPWIVPSNLERICEQLEPVFGSVGEILENHTNLPAHLPFIDECARSTLLAHVLQGQRASNVAPLIGLTGRAITFKPRMAMCLACLAEDLVQRRAPRWRRQHQLAATGVCPWHGSELVAGCGRCHFSQHHSRQSRLPMRKCWCGQPHQPAYPPVAGPSRRLLARMAKLADQLLSGALAGRTPEQIGGYLHLSAQEAGFANGSRIKTPALVERIQREYPEEVLRRLNAVVSSDQNWVGRCFGRMLAPNILGRNLLLFDLFGQQLPGEVDFRKAQDHRDGVQARRAQRATPEAASDETRRARNRALIEAFRQANPGAGRSAVLAAHPGAVIWERQHDAQWYDERFPPLPRGGDRISHADRQRYWEEFDHRTAAHCRTRRQELLNAKGQPKQLTRTVLLKGVARGNEINALMLEKMPLTQAALAEAIESREEYQRRYASWILQQPERKGVDRAVLASRRSGLLMNEIDELRFALMIQGAGQ